MTTPRGRGLEEMGVAQGGIGMEEMAAQEDPWQRGRADGKNDGGKGYRSGENGSTGGPVAITCHGQLLVILYVYKSVFLQQRMIRLTRGHTTRQSHEKKSPFFLVLGHG
eukprot:Gb_05954 [translate_table: standard]